MNCHHARLVNREMDWARFKTVKTDSCCSARQQNNLEGYKKVNLRNRILKTEIKNGEKARKG